MTDIKPVARVWRVIEEGHPKTYWVAEGTGDEAGWKVLAEKQPDRFSIEYCDLYPASAIQRLQERVDELEVMILEAGSHIAELSRLAEAAEARAKVAEERLEKARKVMEQFAAITEEYDPWKEGDDVQGTLVIGSVTDYSLSLGDFRAARAFIKEIGQ